MSTEPRQQPPLATVDDQPPPTYEAATSTSVSSPRLAPPPQTQIHGDGNDASPRSSMSSHDFEEMRNHLTAASDRHPRPKSGDAASAPPTSSSPRFSPTAAGYQTQSQPAVTQSHHNPRRWSATPSDGYRPSDPMSASQDPDAKWADLEDQAGCCFSNRGGCCFSDRGGCCFSDRGGCFFSDRGGCCFADNEGCCGGAPRNFDGNARHCQQNRGCTQ